MEKYLFEVTVPCAAAFVPVDILPGKLLIFKMSDFYNLKNLEVILKHMSMFGIIWMQRRSADPHGSTSRV